MSDVLGIRGIVGNLGNEVANLSLVDVTVIGLVLLGVWFGIFPIDSRPRFNQLNGANGEWTGLDDVDADEELLTEFADSLWSENRAAEAVILSFLCHSSEHIRNQYLAEFRVSDVQSWFEAVVLMDELFNEGRYSEFLEVNDLNSIYLDITTFRFYSVVEAVYDMGVLARIMNRNIEQFYSNVMVFFQDDLNGNNGEWTNGDDVEGLDAALKQLAGVKTGQGNVYVNISKSHHHQKKKSGGRNNPDDFSERDSGKNAGRRVAEHAKREAANVPKEEKKDRPTEKHVCMDEALFGWDGRQAFKRVAANPFLCYGVNDGEVCKSAPPFSLHSAVKKHDLGYVVKYIDGEVKNGDEDMVIIRQPWEYVSFSNDFIHEGMKFSSRSYHVFIPAMDVLKKKFSTTVVTESLVNGMLACLNREFNFGSSDDLLRETALAYIHKCHELNWKLSREQICKTKKVIRDRADEKYLSVLNIQRNNEGVLNFQSVDCDVPNSYIGRTDCIITYSDSHGGKNMWNGNCSWDYVPGDEDTYPHFFSTGANSEGHKYYRSQFLSFDGNNVKPFVTYAVNATNCGKALKRMAGARESHEYDHYLTSMQYSGFGEVVSRLFGAEEFVEDNSGFFSHGRITCETRNGVFTKFLVGSKNFDRVWFQGEKIRRESYVTPYQRRCTFFNTEPQLAEWRTSKHVGVGDLYEVPIYDVRMSHIYCDSPGVMRNLEDLANDCASLRSWVKIECDLPKYRGPAEELNMVHNQMAFGFKKLLDNHSFETVQKYADEHGDHWLYFEGWQRFLSMVDCEQDRSWHAAIEHVKKKLRMMFVQGERVHTPTDIMVKKVDAKVKKEFAKFGKVPRLFVTYDAGCMFANELPEYSKICLDGDFSQTVNGVTTNVCVFAKPGSDKLKAALNEAIHSMGRHNHLNILVYSDDSLWSGNINGVDFAFNVDISSCDSGNKAGVFGLVYMLLSKFRKDLALGLVQQCSKIINLVNPENSDERMSIEMATYFEGSGTVLTTILNHVAMFMIGQVATCLFGMRRQTLRSWTDVRDLIMECGVCFGHVLSVEECMDGGSFVPEKMQFLKRSPVLTTRGHYVPAMNYGPIFRSFGSVEGDMVAEMVGLTALEFSELSWNERWDLFASRVVAGLVHEPDSVVLRALRSRYPLTPKRYESWSEVSFAKDRLQYGGSYVTGDVNLADEQVEDVSLARRYGISVAEMEELASQINASAFGDVFPSSAVGAFFKVDYGLGKYD